MTIAKTSAVAIPRTQWEEFLQSFSEQHRHWQVQLETHDLQTEETVVSHETRLRSIDLDLEDEKNPRINVLVESGNNVIKHILFRPSHLVLHPPTPVSAEALHIDTVHTATTVRFRPVGTTI